MLSSSPTVYTPSVSLKCDLASFPSEMMTSSIEAPNCDFNMCVFVASVSIWISNSSFRAAYLLFFQFSLVTFSVPSCPALTFSVTLSDSDMVRKCRWALSKTSQSTQTPSHDSSSHLCRIDKEVPGFFKGEGDNDHLYEQDIRFDQKSIDEYYKRNLIQALKSKTKQSLES
ncbi:hypothetical protein K501DRAFT_278757 [Backusella circina FSU 941]|nr:hypothetical protein K501DRAFT_278757 [Backusella circina FSU 941]